MILIVPLACQYFGNPQDIFTVWISSWQNTMKPEHSKIYHSSPVLEQEKVHIDLVLLVSKQERSYRHFASSCPLPLPPLSTFFPPLWSGMLATSLLTAFVLFTLANLSLPTQFCNISLPREGCFSKFDCGQHLFLLTSNTFAGISCLASCFSLQTLSEFVPYHHGGWKHSTIQIEMLNLNNNCDVQCDSPCPLSKYRAHTLTDDVTGNVVPFNCCKALM